MPNETVESPTEFEKAVMAVEVVQHMPSGTGAEWRRARRGMLQVREAELDTALVREKLRLDEECRNAKRLATEYVADVKHEARAALRP